MTKSSAMPGTEESAQSSAVPEKPLSNLERLAACETELAECKKYVRTVLKEIALVRRDMAIIVPLSEWAIKTIMAEQEAKLALDKRLGVTKPTS